MDRQHVIKKFRSAGVEVYVQDLLQELQALYAALDADLAAERNVHADLSDADLRRIKRKITAPLRRFFWKELLDSLPQRSFRFAGYRILFRIGRA